MDNKDSFVCGDSQLEVGTEWSRMGFTDGLVIAAYYVGSRVTCSPQPVDTDDDRLCYCTDIERFVEEAEAMGFRVGGSLMGGNGDYVNNDICSDGLFVSLTKEGTTLNVVATSSANFTKRFLAATLVAKRLNLLNKGDRIALFQAVLYGNVQAVETDCGDCERMFFVGRHISITYSTSRKEQSR